MEKKAEKEENKEEAKKQDDVKDESKTEEIKKEEPPKKVEETRKKVEESKKNVEESKKKDEVKKEEKKPQQAAAAAAAFKKKAQKAKAKAKVDSGSPCMPFCGNEPPPADDKRRRRGQSRERKDVLNRGARAPSRDRNCSRERDHRAAANATANKKDEKIKKPTPAENKSLQAMQKRQEKPISFIDCPLCHKVFRFAVEIECGHVFCNSCLRRKMGRHKRCPICKSEIEYIHPCYIMRELVEKFGVKDGPKKLKAELLQVSGYYDEYASEDPIVIATQFIPDPGAGCCTSGGAFDPADLYKIARLDEYVSVEEYLDTVKMVNHIITSWAPGSLGACFGTLCCCFLPSQAQKAVNMIEVVLGDCNLRWAETGLFWTLMYRDGDTRSVLY